VLVPVKGMGVQVPPRTHCVHDLTCGYVLGQDLGRVRCARFPQIRTMGVQVGSKSQNGNNSADRSRIGRLPAHDPRQGMTAATEAVLPTCSCRAEC
jgi:hypothetical protein